MLRSYTKDAVSANQRSKIYFCAHPEDTGLLQSIADDILFHQPGTSIWYYDDPICDRKDRRHENELVQMQVFVIPVTSKFLQEPNAGLDDFRFAIHNGIQAFNQFTLDVSPSRYRITLHSPLQFPFRCFSYILLYLLSSTILHKYTKTKVFRLEDS